MKYTGDELGLKQVAKSVRKKDAMQLVTGQPVFTEDLAPADCLVVKLLRSPYANAIVEEIDTTAALKVDGVEAVFTWKDVDQNAKRYTQAGQTFPEASPYDRLLIDRHVRFVGDVVAIVAGRDEACVSAAMKRIKVKYEVLEPLLDFHQAKDHPILVHPEENWEALCNVGADNQRNLCAHAESSNGDIEAVLRDCDLVIDRTYHTQACQQSMMETFRTFCSLDTYGRLVIVSSTQIVFHVRRIAANALHIPQSKIRVIKPRVGGGFGAKQTSVCEVYPAFVTWMLKKPAKLIFSREESLTASSPRHEMEMHVRIGADRDGHIRGIDLYTLSNTGAYGEHGPTTVGLSGTKTIPLYGRNAEAFRFINDVVYTNVMSAGAYRGYGATQGQFAVESAVNELAAELEMDPFELRLRNLTQVGDTMPAYYGETLTSSALSSCIARVREMSGWDSRPHKELLPNGHIRSLGAAVSMQGSGIGGVDVGSATIKLNDQGFYTLKVSSADMGTGSDTTLAQIAAEVLECSVEDIEVFSADTDATPYDSGSYASSTAYVTGKAVEQSALEVRRLICRIGAQLLNTEESAVEFDGRKVSAGDQQVSLSDIATKSMVSNNIPVEYTCSNSSPTSPPPFMAAVAELETDPETGVMKVSNYYACVDCGTPINPAITRVQTEGGILQGIGMALTESITYSPKGQLTENSFMQYKIPTRVDVGHIHVDFESSYEGSGPFGAKSIGEVVINTPNPAIQEAVYQAVGRRMYKLPIRPEDVVM